MAEISVSLWKTLILYLYIRECIIQLRRIYNTYRLKFRIYGSRCATLYYRLYIGIGICKTGIPRPRCIGYSYK